MQLIVYVILASIVHLSDLISISSEPLIRGMVIDSLHVTSDIKYRFATTTVVSKLFNSDPSSQEAHFAIQLPIAAFISNFSMIIDDEEYPALVQEKQKARKTYERARFEGKTAGYVGSHSRNANHFKVSVNVAAHSNVTFKLKYEELLKRTLGIYEHVIYISPQQLVSDLRIEVFIQESRPISNLNLPAIRGDQLTNFEITDKNEYAQVIASDETSAHILFAPTEEQQREFSEKGILGQFIVNYDVERNYDAGEILTVDGYFVHYYAPKIENPIPKRIMFVLDTSGSMSGRKIAQLKSALKLILNDLREDDEFNIVSFASSSRIWKTEMLNANKTNIDKALRYSSQMYAAGGTNINDALKDALEFLSKQRSAKVPLIFFLTDGQATVGVTNDDKILKNIEIVNLAQHDGQVAIFCLAFGRGADFSLVQKISDQNNGMARKIYEDSDAELQVTGFYDEISDPLISNVKIAYLDNVDEESVTKSEYLNFFDGTEIIVAGKLKSFKESLKSAKEKSLNKTMNETKSDYLAICITGVDFGGPLVINDTIIPVTPVEKKDVINPFSLVMRKTWAYLSIKQMLEKLKITKKKSDHQKIVEKCIELSVKYNFVTPVTAMVVTKPGNKSEASVDGENLEFEDEDSSSVILHRPPRPSYSQPRALSVPRTAGMMGQRYKWRPPAVSYDISQYSAKRKSISGPPSSSIMTKSLGQSQTQTKPKKGSFKEDSYPASVGISSTNFADIFCFDLPSDLVDDSKSLMLLNFTQGHLKGYNRALGTSGSLQQVSVFRAFILVIGKLRIQITPDKLIIGAKRLSWWQTHTYSDKSWSFSLTPNKKIVFQWDNIHLSIFKVGMKTKRSRMKPFLTAQFHFEEKENCTDNGLVVDVMKNVMSLKPVQTRVQYARLQYRYSPIVKLRMYRSEVSAGEKCWRVPIKKVNLVISPLLSQYQMR